MEKSSAPPISKFQECFSYNPATGAVTFKPRPERMFPCARSCKIWNARFSGKPARSKNRKGYLTIRFLGKSYLAHRIAFAITHGYWPEQVDHINGDPADNRFVNLREATNSQNHMNQGLRANNTSGHKGVHWCSARKKWKAQVMSGMKVYRLGSFDRKEDAVVAVNEARERLHGQYANHG